MINKTLHFIKMSNKLPGIYCILFGYKFIIFIGHLSTNFKYQLSLLVNFNISGFYYNHPDDFQFIRPYIFIKISNKLPGTLYFCLVTNLLHLLDICQPTLNINCLYW